MGLAACALAGCGGAGIAEAERGERNSSLYRKAFAAEQAGDTKEAVRLLNRVLVEEPRSFSAHFQLATLLQDSEEDYIGAIYHYKRYLDLRPESEKTGMATNRIRVAEQRLAPQILKKVGDSVTGISQAHLLKENERLNRALTTLEGEKSVLLEEKEKAEKALAGLKGDNERLRDVLRKMRVGEAGQPEDAVTARQAGAQARETPDAADAAGTDAKTLKALREEAGRLAREGANPPEHKPLDRKALIDVPTTESVLKRVEEKLAGEPPAKPDTPAVADKPDVSALPFGKKDKKPAPAGDPSRTYVVQPGDTLYRVAERFYGDSMKWKKIRDANRANVDPDGRLRAGQIIVVP
jgi:nucleoid-associated protein YgaU